MNPHKDHVSRYSRVAGISLLMIMMLFSGCIQKTKDHLSSDANRGSGLLPVPQEVSFTGRDFRFDETWKVKTDANLTLCYPAVQSLLSGLKERTSLVINSDTSENNKEKHLIRMTIRSGSVPLKNTGDSAASALSDQAYSLKLNSSEIVISANTSTGLFYGAQTLLQLLRIENGKVFLPEGEVHDWPDLELRIIYWDCAHHLDKMQTFRHAIKQAAYYKINAFALKLEGHFQYKSAAPIVEPYAITPSEYQELTDYAKSQFVQLIPYLDAPAHVSFILKHPEYAGLRAYPNSNYEFSITNGKTDELLSCMFDDLIDASRGGKYILLSTDEAYYAGKAESEKKAAGVLGSNGKLLAEFITRISNELYEKGRTVIFWGEYPLTLSDIKALPSHLVNGVYNEKWAAGFKQQGIRQLIYTSAQGVEPLFPNYYPLSDSLKGRVSELLKTIYGCNARGKYEFLGAIIAAWGDSGLHPETFWLGYATGSASSWNLTPATARDLTNRFFISFYGPGTTHIERVFRLLSHQAEFWDKSWDWKPSKLRRPVIGNSAGIYDKPRPAMDQTLPSLPVPSVKDLSLDKDWSAENSPRLKSAEVFLKENDELLELLQLNIRNVYTQKYNLRVMHSVAKLCRQNLNMLLDLKHIDSLLKQSSKVALTDPAASISLLDQTLDLVAIIRDQRNETLKLLTDLWYEDWFPRVKEANGRVYLDQVDDIKDHLPVRTIDMSYLIYREINYPLGKWAEEVIKVRNQFALSNRFSPRINKIDWENY